MLTFAIKTVLRCLLNSDKLHNVNKNNRKLYTSLHHVIWLSQNDSTALHAACDEGNVNEVRNLICKENVMINVQDNNGNIPLHISCQRGHADFFVSLMLEGAVETITNDNTYIPAKYVGRKIKLKKMLDRNILQEELLKMTYKRYNKIN